MNAANDRPTRQYPEGHVPVLDVAGTSFECGEQLGHGWYSALRELAQTIWVDSKPWWRDAFYAPLIAEVAPHLPDVFRGMAKGAGLDEDRVGSRLVADSGCTSFAVQPGIALDGVPISGQTKDTPSNRVMRYVVMRMRPTDAPSALTLTYPGWIFGHGFVRGGCSIFRNSLYAGASTGRLSYAIWGTLALHCPRAEAAVELAMRHGITADGSHTVIGDENGGVQGLEMGAGGIAALPPRAGIYTHANHVESGERMAHSQKFECHEHAVSVHRSRRLRECLETNSGRLTAQLCLGALADHSGYPNSICRHAEGGSTTSAVVAEPTRGRLHVTRGPACCNWPTTYDL